MQLLCQKMIIKRSCSIKANVWRLHLNQSDLDLHQNEFSLGKPSVSEKQTAITHHRREEKLWQVCVTWLFLPVNWTVTARRVQLTKSSFTRLRRLLRMADSNEVSSGFITGTRICQWQVYLEILKMQWIKNEHMTWRPHNNSFYSPLWILRKLNHDPHALIHQSLPASLLG